MSYETILLEVDAPGVAWLTFNRPEVRNALNETMVEEVRDLAVAGLRADAEAVARDLNQVKTDVERIRSGFSQLFRGGGSLRGLMQLGPLLDLVTGTLKRSKGN